MIYSHPHIIVKQNIQVEEVKYGESLVEFISIVIKDVRDEREESS